MKKFFSLAIYVMAVLFAGCEPNGVANPTKKEIGVFSVSADKQVTFSQGNLQYTQSTKTWSFAENQWDYIGTDNVTGGTISFEEYSGVRKDGTALADKIDLFGWSTSANNFGVSASKEEDDYFGSFVDWGTNKIGNDAPNTWRTLTCDEWDYIVSNRPNASSLKGAAKVNGVNGWIFLPDNWTCPSGITFKPASYNSESVEAYGLHQTFTANQWSKLEAAGAVFLPAAGNRSGSKVYDVQYESWYWSATEYDDFHACCFVSEPTYMLMYYKDGNYRSDGNSVRLVKDL